MWVSLWLPLDVLQGDGTCTPIKWFQFHSVHFDLITQNAAFMQILGPINGMVSSLNSLDQHNILHMSSAQTVCLNNSRKNKFRRTRVDSSILIIDQ